MSERPRPPRSEVLLVAMCAGTIGFVVAFLWPFFTGSSVLWYYPIERRWSFEVRPDGLAMDFYGRLFAALVVGAICIVATIVIVRALRSVGDRLRGLMLAWAITAIMVGVAYFGWTLANRVPAPEPLPPAYQPR